MTCISSGVHRVHGVQLARSLSNLRSPTLFRRAFAMYGAFLHSDYYAPSDCLQGLGVSLGIAPFLLSTLLRIPFRRSRVRHGGRWYWNDGGGVFLIAPSALCGSPVSGRGRSGLPVLPSAIRPRCIASVPSHVIDAWFGCTGRHIRQGVSGWAFPEGLCTLLANHHVIPQPSATSWILAFSSWRLSGACYSPFRVV